MTQNFANLTTIRGHQLADMNFKENTFIVKGIIEPGLAVLAGPPKAGKSFMALSLAVNIAQGTPFLGLETAQAEVFYLGLEDSLSRIQKRLTSMYDDISNGLHLAVSISSMEENFAMQIKNYILENPKIKLVIIDTLQIIRNSAEMSYKNDYQEMRFLKKLADELNICILVVHHTRKQYDSDPLNRISGTNGLAGAADTIMIFETNNHLRDQATLFCTGRDIETREFKLQRNPNTSIWESVADSLASPQKFIPECLSALLDFLKEEKHFDGTNQALAEKLENRIPSTIDAKALKQAMNKYSAELSRLGITFRNYRDSKNRYVAITYQE